MDPSEAATVDYKQRQREFGAFVYNVEKEQGRVRLRESLKSAASGFECVAVCLRVRVSSLPAHIYSYTHWQRVPRGDEDGQKDVQNKQVFFFLFSLKHFSGGARILDRDVQAELSMTMFPRLL